MFGRGIRPALDVDHVIGQEHGERKLENRGRLGRVLELYVVGEEPAGPLFHLAGCSNFRIEAVTGGTSGKDLCTYIGRKKGREEEVKEGKIIIE